MMAEQSQIESGRRHQFSLRALLLLMLVICAFLAGRIAGIHSVQPALQKGT
jgi:hypothetical protein